MTLRIKTILLFAVLLLAGWENTFSQTYTFKRYTIDNGLKQGYVYDIVQDKKGYVWIATGEGVSRLDGLSITNFSTANGLAEDFTRVLFCSSSGGLWFGHNQGGLTFYNGTKFNASTTEKLVDHPIVDIKEDEDGNMWALAQNGILLKVDKELNIRSLVINKGETEYQCYAFGFLSKSQILVATDMGLIKIDANLETMEFESIQLVDGIPEIDISDIEQEPGNKNKFIISTKGEGVFVIEKSSNELHIQKITTNEQIDELDIESIFVDKDGDLWLSSNEGLYRIVAKAAVGENIVAYNDNNGLPVNYIRKVFQDREGNIWIGTYGEGVCIFEDEYFTFYNFNEYDAKNNVTAILFDKSSQWFGLATGLLNISRNSKEYTFYNAENGFVTDKVTSIIRIKKVLYIGTEKSGLYKLEKETEDFTKIALKGGPLTNSINCIAFDGNLLWIGTKDGLITLNPKTMEEYRYSTENGLLHNNINYLYKDSKNNIYACSQSNSISIVNGRKIEHLKITDDFGLLNIIGMAEDKNGDLWLATYGQGIFKKNGNKFTHITQKEGLKTNYCYAVIVGNDNDLWVGHRQGLSRYNIDNKKIEIFDKTNGITGDCNLNAMYKDKTGNLWFGMNNGALKFNPSKYSKNLIPPSVVIYEIVIGDKTIKGLSEIKLPPGSYKVKFNFVGISFKNPKGIRYRYILEGHDLSWSEQSTLNEAIYPRLDDGEFTFKVKACNVDGYCVENAVEFKLVIEAPFWKRTWFIILCVLVILGGFYLIILYREKSHKRLVEYLDTELAKRTTEVVKQKEQLEQKNKDITDSINYAKRIQSAILPDIKDLSNIFNDSFIFYQPRDIVSGDFYWFQKYGNRFLLACADCTGHGVPGALMSMIGNTLLKELSINPTINSPDKLLAALDHEIKFMLTSDDTERMFEGMDIALFDFDLEAKQATYSGAMRPFIHVSGGEITTVPGTKYSLGGAFDEDKEFKTHQFDMKEGDVVYLFSDGYQDQFGGPENRKLKIAGVINLINEIKDKPMSEQKEAFEECYLSWKGDESQIDDILVIGVRF